MAVLWFLSVTMFAEKPHFAELACVTRASKGRFSIKREKKDQTSFSYKIPPDSICLHILDVMPFSIYPIQYSILLTKDTLEKAQYSLNFAQVSFTRIYTDRMFDVWAKFDTTQFWLTYQS